MSAHWKQQIVDFWGVNATLTPLAGEADLNFKAEVIDGQDLLLKVMHIGCSASLVEMQCQALAYVRANDPSLPIPQVIPTRSGELFTTIEDNDGYPRIVWAIEFMPGQLYASFNPHSSPLAADLGVKLARLNHALLGFKHPDLMRDFRWNLMQAAWIEKHTDSVDEPRRRTLIQTICNDYTALHEALAALPLCPIHNDINDYNLLVGSSLTIPGTSVPGTSVPGTITGIIDFGDMCLAPRICELSIAGAYLVLDHDDPISMLEYFVRAYHRESPLTTAEIDVFYYLLRMRLAVSLVISSEAHKTRPNDDYAIISQAPAWRFLESISIHPAIVTGRLRVACELPVTDNANQVIAFLRAQRGQFNDIMPVGFDRIEMVTMSVADSGFPQNPLELSESEAQSMGVLLKPGITQLGYYAEPRMIYSSPAFRDSKSLISARRSVHLGLDIFAAPNTPIYAPMDATLVLATDQQDRLDYGGLVILQHTLGSGTEFYSLWGHLDPSSLVGLKAGQQLAAGDQIGTLGKIHQNGGWAPHLHLQLALNIAGLESGWPGVANPDQRLFWTQLCPNPAALLGLSDDITCHKPLDESAALGDRQELFGSNLKLSYQQPVMFLRGYQHYLFDQWGRTYLDAYNNVPHVGHAHARIQKVACEQLGRLNSNTRYLHPAPNALAKKLRSKLPKELTTCYFVNSGSEANELALRLARAHTGAKDIITPDHGYHGNTTGAIDISAYKFNAQGGVGKPDWVQLIDAPDTYRGRYRAPDENAALNYAGQVDSAVQAIHERGAQLAGFIAETYPSVGGQIIPPSRYFKYVYERIRAAGGVCIADEVQTGLGRLGEYYFAFEQQEVIPDIVVLGKPIANGHPMGVVVTTSAIANSFAQGPEFFSTFGGSTLSCRLALEVLNIVDDEQLQDNARVVGARLLDGLRQLQSRHACIGDVRGLGLFIGAELVSDRDQRTPSPAIASYVVNRLKENRILVGVEGPHNNVLKIRPPLTIDLDSIETLLRYMDQILSESVVANFMTR